MISGLECAKLKLIRAAEHIKEINPYIATYIASVLYEVVSDPKGKDTVHVRQAPPPEIGLIAGEALYHIRSALDYLAFDLVKLNPSSIHLPSDWEENCVFPLWVETPKKAPVYNCFKSKLPGISKPVFTFIESVQPYHRSKRATLDDIPRILWLLAQLSNIDKHRHLNITPLQISEMQHVAFKYGGARVTFRTLRSGAEIESTAMLKQKPMTVNVKREFSSYVTFDESALGSDESILAVQLVLEVCLDAVKSIIVPAFEKFIKNP